MKGHAAVADWWERGVVEATSTVEGVSLGMWIVRKRCVGMPIHNPFLLPEEFCWVLTFMILPNSLSILVIKVFNVG